MQVDLALGRSFPPDVEFHFPLRRELDGIAHEVDNDLASRSRSPQTSTGTSGESGR